MTSEALVVRSKDFIATLETLFEDDDSWEIHYDPSQEFVMRSNRLPLRLMAAGVYKDHRVAYRALRRFRLELDFINLSTADRILTALEIGDRLGNELPIIPNPRWSEKTFLEIMARLGVDPQPYLDAREGLATVK